MSTSGGLSAHAKRSCTPIASRLASASRPIASSIFLAKPNDTLKDAERRAAYDEELRHSRQLTRVETKGKPPGAFAMGLAFGLLLAGAGIGAKLFLDAGRSTPKSQDFSDLP